MRMRIRENTQWDCNNITNTKNKTCKDESKDVETLDDELNKGE